MNSRANVSKNTTIGYDMNTDSCISTGKVAMAFGIAALLFSMATAYKVAVFGQPTFSFIEPAHRSPLAGHVPDSVPAASMVPVSTAPMESTYWDQPKDKAAFAQPRVVSGVSPATIYTDRIDRVSNHADILELSARELILIIEDR